MWSPVLLLATIAPYVAFASNCDTLRQPSNEAWNGGRKAYLSIPVDEDIQDWELTITFDRPIDELEQWTANQTPEDSSSSYSFSGKDWNSVVSAGNKLSFDFIYRWPVDEEAPAITSITFNGVELSLEACPETTVAPTMIITTPKPATCGASERKRSCKRKSGFCTNDRKSCRSIGGKVAKKACSGNACYCCIPPPPTTTKAPTTTVPVTTTQPPTTTQAPTITQSQTTTQAPTTTVAATTTQAPTTTQTQTTTQVPTSTVTATTTDTQSTTQTSMSNCDILRLPSNEAWNGGRKAYLSIPVVEDLEDWDLTIIFDRPVEALEQWNANQSPEDSSSSYTFSGKDWNSIIPAGNKLSFDFIYRWPVDEEAPVITSVTFNSEELSLQSCTETTVSSTTIITTPKPASTTTQTQTTTEADSTIEAQTTTQAPSSTEGVTTTEAQTTKSQTTTEGPTTTMAATTTEAQTSSPVPPTTLFPTTAQDTTSEINTTTEDAQTETTSATLDCGDVAQYLESWYGGWKGKVNIPIINNIQGWNIEIVFDKAVDKFEQWSVNSSPSGNSEKYTLTGIDGYNSDLTAGSTLSFDFLYRYQGHEDLPKITAVKFNGQNVCGSGNGNGNGGTTLEPATTIAVTTEEPGEPITSGPTSSCESIGEAKYNYDEVLHKSLLFYEAQRSGDLPDDNRVSWRKDSALNDKDGSIDLTGGYYDAGDFVKFGFPMAGTATILAWGAVEYRTAYEDAGEMEYMKDAVKWATDYFIKAHVSPNVLYGQVGNGDIDHGSWGRPEDMTMSRPAYKIDASKPGSELAGETSAALASAAILFSESDPEYADELLEHAEQLYNFANTHRGKYSDSITDAATYYNSWGGYNDELAWAAAWLYRATNDTKYLTAAESHYNNLVTPNEFSWDDKTAGVQVLLAQLTNKAKYKEATKSFCDEVINNKPRTPKGLVYFSKWGPLRYAANAAYICLRAADLGIKPTEYREFGQEQIHYMLGDTGRSFVIGFGDNYPQRPHHRSSSCPSTGPCGWPNYNSNGPNPHTLVGALVGGPDANDNYNDARDDYLANEVTTDYNAGFQSAVAALRQAACNEAEDILG